MTSERAVEREQLALPIRQLGQINRQVEDISAPPASCDDPLLRKAICVLGQRPFQRGPELTRPTTSCRASEPREVLAMLFHRACYLTFLT